MSYRTVIRLSVFVSIWQLANCDTDALLESYRLLFADKGQRELVYNTTGDHIKVISIIPDPSKETDYIVSTKAQVILLLDTEAQNTTILAGAFDEKGFVDGVGADVRVNQVYSLIFIPSLNEIIISDIGNDCLRTFNRSTLRVSSYAGECETSGDVDGYRLDARLSGIHTLLLDEAAQLLYMSDRNNGKMKVMPMGTEVVSTYATIDETTTVKGFTIFNSVMTVLKNNSILQETALGAFNEIMSNQDGSLGSLKRIVALSNRYYLVTDYFTSALLLLDTIQVGLTPICKHQSSFSSLDILNCTLEQQVMDVMIHNGVAYLPMAIQDQIMLKELTLNCPIKLWENWTRCNSSTGVGSQYRTRGYPCEQDEERRLCWSRPSTGGEQTYYVSVSRQCSLERELPGARHKLECASHCSADDTCLAYIYDKGGEVCSTATTMTGGSEDCYLKGT